MITALNVDAEVTKRFPGFDLFETMPGLPTVVFTFLTLYIQDAAIRGRGDIVRTFIQFLGDITAHPNDVDEACLDEAFICICSFEKIDYREVTKWCTPDLKQRFLLTLDRWTGKRVDV